MYIHDLKNWIQKKLLSKNNNIRHIKFLSLLKKNDKNILEIINLTSFLPDNCTCSEKIYCIMNDIMMVCMCKTCKNSRVTFKSFARGYRHFCSPRCSKNYKETNIKYKQTCLKRYGVENVFQSKATKNKIKQTCLKKYGVENILQSEATKNKIKQTCLEKYGVENVFQSKVTKNKIKQTCLERYGVENPSQSKDIINKSKKTCIERYGFEHPFKSKIIQQKRTKTNLERYGVENFNHYHINKNDFITLNDKKEMKKFHHDKKLSIPEISKILNVSTRTVWLYLKKHDIIINRYFFSSHEKEIINFINNSNILVNNRSIIPPLELDIYIPEANLAIEFDGLYWHSIHDKNYHLNKTKLCQEKGIQLLHVFENEWADPIKQYIWKSIINNKLGKNNRIFARKTEIREITNNKIVKEFLNNNHLQGYCGSSVKLGLFYENELVSLMTFGKTRFSRKYEWEMIRFCNKKFISIIGGASKLYKYFINNYKPKSIISYADRRYSDGNLYDKLGFEFSHYSSPNYWYFKNNNYTLYSRVKFQKHKLENLLENFDPRKSEIENMLANGYLRIFDCGNIIYKI